MSGTLNLYTARGPAQPGLIHPIAHLRHWLLILAYKSSTTGSYYHTSATTSTTTLNNGQIRYKHRFEHNVAVFQDRRVEYDRFIGSVPANWWSEIDAIMRSVSPRRCQEYVAAVLERLEKVKLVMPSEWDFVGLLRRSIERSHYGAVLGSLLAWDRVGEIEREPRNYRDTHTSYCDSITYKAQPRYELEANE
ncbi:hypothetical protein BDV19DRAFT_391982 [Aspergillus venezuelensis]